MPPASNTPGVGDPPVVGQGEHVTALSTTTPPRLVPLYAAGFVTAFGANGIAAAVGGEHLELGLTLAWLGLFLALYDVAELVLKPVFGALSDRIGPRPVIVGGLVVFAAASLIGVFGTGPFWLGLARLLQGAGASAFSPASSPRSPASFRRTVAGRTSVGTARGRVSATPGDRSSVHSWCSSAARSGSSGSSS